MTSRETLSAILVEEPGQQCAQCDTLNVRWYLPERGDYLTHDGARRACRFPCAGACGHRDCADARQAITPLSKRLGDLFSRQLDDLFAT